MPKSRSIRTAALRCILFAMAATSAAWTPASAQQTSDQPQPSCDFASVQSPPGRIWWAHERWRYADDAAAIAAYATLANGQSPWPDWFDPPQTVLPAGTRFQMAMSPGQPETSPGGFGTFDLIEDAEDVREYLAVQYEWKPEIDHVVTYEVTNPLPVAIGPVGPQVDRHLCQLLPGRWSQFQMLVIPANRMDYLTVIEVRQIR